MCPKAQSRRRIYDILLRNKQKMKNFDTCLLWLCISVLCFRTINGVFFISGGELSPSGDLYLTTYIAFELNCTLTTYEGNGNASNMDFQITTAAGTDEFPKEWQMTVSEDTLRLQIPAENVTTEASGYYRCRIYEELIAEAEVIFKDIPKAVTNLTCVSPNLNYMNCTFCPEVDDQTTYLFSWDIESLSDKSGNCDNSSCSSQFLVSDNNCYFNFGLKYTMNVQARNFYGEVNSIFEITADGSIVKANPVSNLRAVPQSSSSMLVTWTNEMADPILEFTQLQFYVTYTKTNKNGEILEKIVNWNNSVLLEDLAPYTSYTVSVQSKPKVGGYWSDISETTSITHEAAPSSGPGVAPGAFRIACTVNSTDCNTVYVYWQAVPELERNGIILGYEISYTGTDNGHFVSGKVAADDTYFKFEREKAQPYEVEIMAYTSAGTSPPSRQTVPFPLEKSPMNIEAEFITEETIEFKWEAPEGSQLDSYTLFSCKGNREVNSVCQAPTEQMELPAESTGYNLTGQNGEQVYGIAANYISPSTSSGLAPRPEWICVYHFSGKPPIPIIDYYMVDETTLRITWNRVECRDQELPVRIIYYRITVTTLDNTTDSNKYPINEEFPSTQHMMDVVGVIPGNTYIVEMQSFSKDQASGKAEKTIPIAVPMFPPWKIVLIMLAVLILGCILSAILWRFKKKQCAAVNIETPEKPDLLVNEDSNLLADPDDQRGSKNDLGPPGYASLIEMKPPEKSESDDNHSNSSGYESLRTTNPPEGGTPNTSRQTSKESDTSSPDQIEPYQKVGPKEPPDTIAEPEQVSTPSYPYPTSTETGSNTSDGYLGSGVIKQDSAPEFDKIGEGPPVPPSYRSYGSGGDSGDGVWEVDLNKSEYEAPSRKDPGDHFHASVSPLVQQEQQQVPQEAISGPHSLPPDGCKEPALSEKCVMLKFDGVKVDLPSSLLNVQGLKIPSLHFNNKGTAKLEQADCVDSEHSEDESDESVEFNSSFSTDGYTCA